MAQLVPHLLQDVFGVFVGPYLAPDETEKPLAVVFYGLNDLLPGGISRGHAVSGKALPQKTQHGPVYFKIS
jgi:hypothetical protein